MRLVVNGVKEMQGLVELEDSGRRLGMMIDGCRPRVWKPWS